MTKLMRFIAGLIAGTCLIPSAHADPKTPPADAKAEPAIPTVDSLEIIAVTDNYFDMFQAQEKNATRHLLTKVAGLDGVAVKGEMGLGFVIKATKDNVSHTLLFDAGLTKETYINNLAKLGIDISKAEALVISHGHEDHWGGIPVALDRTSPKAPVYVGHEDAFLQHLFVIPTNSADMGTLSRKMLTKRRRPVVVASTPTVIAGVGLLTGFIPKTNTFETIPPALKVKRNGVLEDAQFDEEISLVFNVAGKGLVVITGCGHRGVINATNHAKKITGIRQVAGVIGGFHLTTAPQSTIDQTVAAFQAINPTFLMPMHCTGNRALNAFMNAMPTPYVHPSVGTKYSF